MKIWLYRLWQWTWGLPQTLTGALLTLWYRKNPHFRHNGAVVTLWDRPGSASFGMFLFLSTRLSGVGEGEIRGYGREILKHEYGHTFQSLMLGPLFLLIIGVPSLIWAGSPRLAKLRQKRKIPYNALYTERWADHLGKVGKKEDPGSALQSP